MVDVDTIYISVRPTVKLQKQDLHSDDDFNFTQVHVPSMTVFSNFPERKVDSLRIPTCMDFSLNSGYFSIGTHRGSALLYRLVHV